MTPVMLLYQDMPIPDSWIPGYAGYVAGVEQLDQVVDKVVKVRTVALPCEAAHVAAASMVHHRASC